MSTNILQDDLAGIAYERSAKRRRISSYDRTGGNDDRIYIQPGETRVFAAMDKPGCIKHIWMTISNDHFQIEHNALRKVLIRYYWDGEENPSVETPLGDFYGMGHAQSKNFVSAPLQMSPENGLGLNSWWPMPYQKAKLTIVNECQTVLILYFYVDYEEYEELPSHLLRFHALWHRECPTEGIKEALGDKHAEWCFEGKNPNGENNYVILEATGKGHYCGANINIHNLSVSDEWNWPGEGDDMTFIDGEKHASIHGTGTEDYVNMAWCPTQEYSAPYHGLILGGRDNWKGKISYYRYHLLDPIMFDKSIKVSIEHGHANHRSDDWSTTAYWYQSEPHAKFANILKVEDRLPVDEGILLREKRVVKEDKEQIIKLEL